LQQYLNLKPDFPTDMMRAAQNRLSAHTSIREPFRSFDSASMYAALSSGIFASFTSATKKKKFNALSFADIDVDGWSLDMCLIYI
jgi:hypothetical protein